jgi:hypothetical protein
MLRKMNSKISLGNANQGRIYHFCLAIGVKIVTISVPQRKMVVVVQW